MTATEQIKACKTNFEERKTRITIHRIWIRVLKFSGFPNSPTIGIISLLSLLTAIADAARPGRSLGSLW